VNEPAADFPWATFLHNVNVLAEEEGSTEAFCAATGLSFWTVNAWRQGRNIEPKHLTLQAIADHYDMTVDDLIGKRLPRRSSK
jgi:hypothetical protein